MGLQNLLIEDFFSFPQKRDLKIRKFDCNAFMIRKKNENTPSHSSLFVKIGWKPGPGSLGWEKKLIVY